MATPSCQLLRLNHWGWYMKPPTPLSYFRFSPSGSSGALASAASRIQPLLTPSSVTILDWAVTMVSCCNASRAHNKSPWLQFWDFLQLFSTKQPQKLWKCTADPVTWKLRHWKGYLTVAYRFQPHQATPSSHLITSLPSLIPTQHSAFFTAPQTQQVCVCLRASVHLMMSCPESSYLRGLRSCSAHLLQWLLQCLTSEVTLTITLKTETHPHTPNPPESFPQHKLPSQIPCNKLCLLFIFCLSVRM